MKKKKIPYSAPIFMPVKAKIACRKAAEVRKAARLKELTAKKKPAEPAESEKRKTKNEK